MLKKGVILLGISALLFSSCINYKPEVKRMWEITRGIDFGKLCAEEEKKKGQEWARTRVTGTFHAPTGTMFRLRCGGFIDECHYKVNWYYYYDVSGREKFVESQIVDVCK